MNSIALFFAYYFVALYPERTKVRRNKEAIKCKCRAHKSSAILCLYIKNKLNKFVHTKNGRKISFLFMNCLIADDNELALIMLNSLIAQTKTITVVAKCTTAIEAFDYLNEHTVDIAFLDVEMPGMTGIELIKALPKKPVVVLLTANPAYAVDAFDLNVADYIVKPVTLARLLQAIEKATTLLSKKNEPKTTDNSFLFVKEKNVLKRVMLNDILFIEAMGDYIKIHCADKWYTANTSLRAVEEKYNQYFLKVHRSYLVAVSKIESIDESMIHIGKNMVPVAESFRKKLLEKLDLM